jgi:type IV secretory pathway VirB2 component (pilin)
MPTALASLSNLLAAGSSGGSVNFDFNPGQPGNLPGEGTLSSLASGIGHWALLASIVGVVVGGVMWAFGHFSHNYQQSYNGRKGVLVSAIAALLIGGSSEIISFFFNAGAGIK